MRKLRSLTRRRFGQGLGFCLALAGLGPAALRQTASAREGSRKVTVRITGFAFVPERLEIAAGDTVVFHNEDLAPHTASHLDGDWDTGDLARGAEARLAFETLGDFPYFCAHHPHMTGTIVVRRRRGG